jgi:hypothetical protein
MSSESCASVVKVDKTQMTLAEIQRQRLEAEDEGEPWRVPREQMQVDQNEMVIGFVDDYKVQDSNNAIAREWAAQLEE